MDGIWLFQVPIVCVRSDIRSCGDVPGRAMLDLSTAKTPPVSALCWRPRPIKPVGRQCGRSLLAKRPVTRFSAGSAGKNRLANIDHSQFVDLRRLVRHGKCYGHRCATQLFHWADPAGGGWRSLLGPLRRSATRYVGPPRCSGPSGAVRLVQRPFCVFRGRPRSRSK